MNGTPPIKKDLIAALLRLPLLLCWDLSPRLRLLLRTGGLLSDVETRRLSVDRVGWEGWQGERGTWDGIQGQGKCVCVCVC